MLTRDIASEYGEYNNQCIVSGFEFSDTLQTATHREFRLDGE